MLKSQTILLCKYLTRLKLGCHQFATSYTLPCARDSHIVNSHAQKKVNRGEKVSDPTPASFTPTFLE